MSGDGQVPDSGGYSIPALKFVDTGYAVPLHQNFVINPPGRPTPQSGPATAPSPAPQNGYFIPAGAIIYHSDANTTRIFDAGGSQLTVIDDTGSSSLPTPDGYLPATRIYQVPGGSVISETGNVTRVSFHGERILTVIDQKPTLNRPAPPVIPTLNGWIEDTNNWNARNIAEFVAYWKVPVNPPSPQAGTVDFLFNGLEPASTGNAIVQPVLEWNQVGSGTWTGRAWYVGPSGGYMSNPIYVTSGQVLEGTLRWDTSVNLWNITIADQQTRQSVTIYSYHEPQVGMTNLATFCALEGYGVYDNSDICGSTTFYDMRFLDPDNQPAVVPWDSWIYNDPQHTLSGLNVRVNSQSMVTLQTANPGLPPAITRVSPVKALNITPDLNISITGTNFWGTPVIRLMKAGSPDITGSQVTISSPSSVSGSFNVDGAAAGRYNVVVTNPDGQQAVLTNGFTISAPVSDFVASPLTGDPPLMVLFTNTSTNSPKTWNWTFGDGNVTNATDENPVHTYWWPGKYNVTLTVSTIRGNSSVQKQDYITVTRPVPTIIAITPGGIWYRNATINYTISGTKFQPGFTSITFRNKSGMYLNGTDAGVTFVNATIIKGQIHVPFNAPAGPWNVSITTMYSGPVWRDSVFTVKAVPRPTFISITPAGIWYRNSTVNYSIAGTNFQPGNTVLTFWNKAGTILNATSGSGVTSVTTTRINGTILILKDAPTGTPYNITISTADGGTAGRDAAITVRQFPAPVIASFIPAAGYQNTTVSFVVSGSNFQTAAGYTNITLVNVFTDEKLYGTILSSTGTSVTGTIAVPARVTAGPYNLVVTTVDGGPVTRAGACTIGYFPLPVISAINLSSGYRNSTVPFTITGNYFQPNGGTYLRLYSAAGTTVPAVLSNVTGTKLTGTFTIPYNAATGMYRLDILTISGGSASKSGAFTIKPFPAPTITSITPNFGYRNTSVSFTLKGTNFQPGRTTMTFWNRTGNTILVPATFSVTSTQLVGNIAIPLAANQSWYVNISTTDGGNVSREKVFTVR